MAGVVRIDVDDGDVTPYGTAFRNRLVFDAFSADFPSHGLIALMGPEATAAPVAVKLTGGTDYVTGVGHGEYGSFIGTDGLAIWHPGSDLSALGGAIVHLLSCQTGASLGLRIVSSGARAFWGYSVDFQFFFRKERPADLADDPVAEVFFRMDVIVDRGMLAGKTAQEIHESVGRYVAAVLPQLDNTQRIVMLSNYVHLVWPGLSWGDPGATI
jgi:hypothetical protein